MVPHDVSAVSDIDRLAAENVLAVLQSDCGRRMLDGPVRPETVGMVSRLIGQTTLDLRKAHADAIAAGARHRHALSRAQTALERFAANPGQSLASAPPAWHTDLHDALRSMGSAYSESHP